MLLTSHSVGASIRPQIDLIFAFVGEKWNYRPAMAHQVVISGTVGGMRPRCCSTAEKAYTRRLNSSRLWTIAEFTHTLRATTLPLFLSPKASVHAEIEVPRYTIVVLSPLSLLDPLTYTRLKYLTLVGERRSCCNNNRALLG